MVKCVKYVKEYVWWYAADVYNMEDGKLAIRLMIANKPSCKPQEVERFCVPTNWTKITLRIYTNYMVGERIKSGS